MAAKKRRTKKKATTRKVEDAAPEEDDVASRESKVVAMADALVAWISEGKTLRAFARDNGVHYSTVYRYIQTEEDLAQRIAHARDMGFAAIAEECLEIADNTEEGIKIVESEDGDTTTREDMLGHRKLRIWTRLQLLAKWDPKRYGGDKHIQVSVGTGQQQGPPEPEPQEFQQLCQDLAGEMPKLKRIEAEVGDSRPLKEDR